MRIVAFDLDGTLIRGKTACEAIAEGIGRAERMGEFEQLRSDQFEEVRAAREEMAGWYSSYTTSDLCAHLAIAPVAPGVVEAFSLLHEEEFKIAIVSLTWSFAAQWFADRWGADYSVGTRLSPDEGVTHFWPQDKALWLTGLADSLGVSLTDVTAVGDSRGDIPMLLVAGHRYWVGEAIPPELEDNVIHAPDGNVLCLTRRIVEHRPLL